MAQKKKPTKAASLDYSNVKPEEDGRSWYTPPPGWAPAAGLPLPDIRTATPEDYEAVIRKLLLPHEDFWRDHANHEAYRQFIKDKTDAERALLAEAFQLDLDATCPTLDDCIPRGSILEAVDRYFWEYTDIPRELPFFYVMHFVMANLLQQGVQIHKGKQVILPDLWTVVLAPSGAGKSLSQKELNKALDAKINLFSEAKTSLQFLTNLRDQRLALYLRDEFAQFLKEVNKEPSMQNVRDYLLRTYDNGDIEHTTTTSSVKVKNSAISILGYTPTKTLQLHLTKEMILDGFAQRFSYCVAEKDDRPIVGDYDFDRLADRISPLWNKISSIPAHQIYTVSREARGAFNKVAQTIIGKAREENVDDSFSRRLAFTTYKYGLAYHFLAGKTTSEIDAEDLGQAAQLVALHLRDLRKVLDLYEPVGKASAPLPRPTPTKDGVVENTVAHSASLQKPSAALPAVDKLSKVVAFLEKQRGANAAPVSLRKLQSSIRAVRGSADEARSYAEDAIAQDPSLAPFVILKK